ncbi:hypothetical protein ACFV2B_37680 [Streptomyces lavendulae]|uniref:hypothetical protein n=1 Tax=Streptomyces lavendulae TaxID=1914 RepID=UPI0036BA9825
MGRLTAEKASLRDTSSLFVQNDVRTGDELRMLGTKSKLEGLWGDRARVDIPGSHDD